MHLLPKLFATVCFLSLCVGLLTLKFPRFRPLHPRLMLFGVSGDLALVLFLEFTRGAIAEAAGGTLNAWQYGHIATSVLACLIYLPVLKTGLRLWRMPTLKGSARISEMRWHKRLGVTAFVLRTVGFLLMFSMPSKT